MRYFNTREEAVKAARSALIAAGFASGEGYVLQYNRGFYSVTTNKYVPATWNVAAALTRGCSNATWL